MHIIIGVLGSVVTILFLLDRMGIDIGGLNPFYWLRRRRFRQRYGADPIFSVEDPVHVAALLVIGVAKLDGDLSAEQKKVARTAFEKNFSLDGKEASQLFGSAAHLLAAPQLLENQLTKLVDMRSDAFTPEQAESVVRMMTEVASADDTVTASQQAFIDEFRSRAAPPSGRQGPWA